MSKASYEYYLKSLDGEHGIRRGIFDGMGVRENAIEFFIISEGRERGTRRIFEEGTI